MIELLETRSPKIIGFRCSGTLHDEDYQILEPRLESAIEKQGPVRLFAQFDDFHGWDLHAIWDELRIGVKHANDFEKIAMVGDKQWERWMAKFTGLFTGAKVRYFDVSEMDRAWYWIEDDSFLSFH